jgi:hypothetical protein
VRRQSNSGLSHWSRNQRIGCATSKGIRRETRRFGPQEWNPVQSRLSRHAIHPSCQSKGASNPCLPAMRFVSCAVIPKDTIGTWSLLSSLIVPQNLQAGFDQSSARDAMPICAHWGARNQAQAAMPSSIQRLNRATSSFGQGSSQGMLPSSRDA